ncbi:RNA polymerase sigma factor [Microlunatus sp. GCM10028923]|uniref:RNA polymerase sigma factor n=1 Tax=Microlunatus sp. GCM10028923 TaxID=3273400 RepID=UPI0036118F74
MMAIGGRVSDVRDDERQSGEPAVPAAELLWPADLDAIEPDPVDLPSSDDGDLWERLRSADEEAFRELFLRHNKAVYNYAFRGTGSWAAADDVVQVVFTAVLRRALAADLPALRLASARPILFAMARKECANQLRSVRRQARLADRIRMHETGHAADNTAEWLAAETAMRQIAESLQVLPANQREVIALVRWSGLSLAEAAESLGVPIGTVKSRLNRAQRRLGDTPLAGLLRGERS